MRQHGMTIDQAQDAARVLNARKPLIKTEVQIAARHMNDLPADDRRYTVYCTTLTWHYTLSSVDDLYAILATS